jgi:hypothetical protein
MLRYAFHGTQLTLRSLGQAIVYPIALSLAGIGTAELTLHLLAPQRLVPQLVAAALGFGAAYLLAIFVRPIREEAMSLRRLLGEFRLSGGAPTAS